MYAKNFKHYFHIPKAKLSSKAHYCWAKIQYLEFWLRIEFLLKENMGKGGTNDLKCLNFQVFSLAELLLQQFVLYRCWFMVKKIYRKASSLLIFTAGKHAGYRVQIHCQSQLLTSLPNPLSKPAVNFTAKLENVTALK